MSQRTSPIWSTANQTTSRVPMLASQSERPPRPGLPAGRWIHCAGFRPGGRVDQHIHPLRLGQESRAPSGCLTMRRTAVFAQLRVRRREVVILVGDLAASSGGCNRITPRCSLGEPDLAAGQAGQGQDVGAEGKQTIRVVLGRWPAGRCETTGHRWCGGPPPGPCGAQPQRAVRAEGTDRRR